MLSDFNYSIIVCFFCDIITMMHENGNTLYLCHESNGIGRIFDLVVNGVPEPEIAENEVLTSL